MPQFTTHRLIAIAQGNNRYRCTICRQQWVRVPRPACPGVPVLSEKIPHFKTMTALARERKYPIDLEKPDAAYRILNAPYYNWLYDERKAVHLPLTQAQIAATEKRRATMREKYGCRLCDGYFSAKDQEHFRNRVCGECQGHARGWNELLDWSRQMIEARALVLDCKTDPAERPLSHHDPCPLRHLHHMSEYLSEEHYSLTDCAAIDLASGEYVYRVEQIKSERDLLDLRYLLAPASSAITTPPTVISPARFILDVAYQALGINTCQPYRQHYRSPFELNPALEIMTVHGVVYRDRAWHSIRAFEDSGRQKGLTEQEHFGWTCGLLGILPERAFESGGQLLRRIILFLAEQEPIVI